MDPMFFLPMKITKPCISRYLMIFGNLKDKNLYKSYPTTNAYKRLQTTTNDSKCLNTG